MNYEDFYNKYANRKTCESYLFGTIQVYRDDSYKLKHLTNCVISADVWVVPTLHGWGYNESKRNKFYIEAKKAKLASRKDKKNEWYKIISIK